MRIDSVEDYNILVWLQAEHGFKANQEAEASGDVSDYYQRLHQWNVALLKSQGVEVAPHVPHPNEVAAREAVSVGLLDGAELGLV